MLWVLFLIKEVSLKLKGKILPHSCKTDNGVWDWILKSQQDNKLNVVGIRMLWSISRYTRQDKIRNEYIREKVGGPTVKEMVESRLKWFNWIWTCVKNSCRGSNKESG